MNTSVNSCTSCSVVVSALINILITVLRKHKVNSDHKELFSHAKRHRSSNTSFKLCFFVTSAIAPKTVGCCRFSFSVAGEELSCSFRGSSCLLFVALNITSNKYLSSCCTFSYKYCFQFKWLCLKRIKTYLHFPM